MSALYEGAPATYGGFTSPVPGGSSNAGFYQQPMNLPFYSGRSILATIPEYLRNPLQMEKDLLFKLSEGRNNFMRLLLEQSEMGGGIEVNDVRFRLPIEVEPQGRLYIEPGAAGTPITAVTSAGLSTITVRGNTTKIATAKSGGNPKQVGDIARLEVGQFIMLMFSWVEPRRTAAVVSGSMVSYGPEGIQAAPVPEICKIVSVDYTNSKITVTRNWAGSQRTSFTYSTTTIPTPAIIAVASGVTGATYSSASTDNAIPAKYAFFIPMAKSMKEDEIDAKIKNFSNTWTSGIMQRHLLAWGSSQFAEVISGNMGIESPLAKSKRYALKQYYDDWEWQAIFGEQSETFDAETGYWSGTTDGILANIPKSHYVAIKGIDYNSTLTSGLSTNFGSFNPLVFNKMLEGKALIGSAERVLLCGGGWYTDFSAMINFMTQAVPDIKSDWKVEGKEFRSSEGLKVSVVLSDKMTLNGMNNSAVLYDKATFKPLKLRNYPSADVYEIQNENPLKKNGFIHGVKGFVNLNPDSAWVFTKINKEYSGGTTNATAYGNLDPVGEYLA